MLTTNEKRLFSKVEISHSGCVIRCFRGTMNLLLWTLLIAGMLGVSGCGSEGGSSSSSEIVGSSSSAAGLIAGSSSTSGTANAGTLPTQHWTLTNDSGDVAYVVIVPFTANGTFTETCNSPGWWLRDANNNRTVRIPLNGTVMHSGQSDTWDFTISELSGGARLTGLGTGSTIDGTYPAARNVQGTVSETATSPTGAVTVLRTWTWSGNNYSVWN